MPRLLVLYEKPTDPARFAEYFRNTHMPLVRRLPGLRSCSFGPTARVGEAETRYFWVWQGVYNSVDAIRMSHASPEGVAVMNDIPNLSPTLPIQMALEGSEG